ncbi:MAG: hypothetical protein DI566_11495 [Microbacterium sp.]|nr:MAG: hypothetical protein DI566_11495 [Microbacterium sp.]
MRRSAAVTALVAALVLSFGLAGCVADDAPDPSPPVEEDRLPPLADPLPLAAVEDFGAVATMNAGANCTGTLIDTGVATGPAYVLTNGHCVGDVGRPAQATTLGEDWFGTAEFFRAEGNLDATVTVDVTEIAYSTMRHTDTAIVRLDATLDELDDLGVHGLPIADAEPDAGDAVVNVGVPVAGLIDDEWVLRRGECTFGAQHTVIEFFWLWFGVWSNDCPGIRQGSSGSPLLAVDGDGAPTQIVGMINTTSWGMTAADGGACFINRPCQVEGGTATMVEQTAYAQSVAGIGSCFDETGSFALTGACPLPVSDIWALAGGGSFRGGDLPDSTGRTPEVTLVGGEPGTVRTALVPLGDGAACTAPATYDGAPPAPLTADTDAAHQDSPLAVDLPEKEGRYLLCAVRDDGYEAAASVLFEVDRTPPLVEAGASIEDIGGGGVVVRPHLDPPEISNVRFAWGSPGSVDCDDTASFQDFFIVPLTLTADQLPVTYCIYGMDAAGNPTPVTRIDIPAS